MLKRALKKKVGQAKGRWAEELPYILWAYWTTFCTSIGHTMFELAFGVEARLPVEIDHPTAREMYFQPVVNEKLMLEQLDDIQEIHADAQENILKAKQTMAR